MAHVFDLQEVRPRLLHEIAATEVRKAIHSGAYAQGEKLNEVEIARALNLSRGPVREALRLLEQEGIVTSEPQKGVRVAVFSQRDIFDALALRESVETLACSDIAEQATDEDIESLISCVAEMKRAEAEGRFVDLAELDHKFHEIFLNISSTEIVKRVWRSIGGAIKMFQVAGDKVFSEHGSVADSHLPIIEALKSRDSKRLRCVVINHIEENRTSMLSDKRHA